MWDVEGKRYIDFAGGIAVLNTGHRHPKIVEAVKAQLDKVHHTCFQVLAYEPYIDLAERLIAKAPGDFAKKAFFLTTGAEAVENAVKIARSATKRSAVIAFGGGFHGRTLLGMGADRQGRALQGRLRPVPGRDLPRQVPERAARRQRGRRARLDRSHLQVRRRGRARRRAHHRAGAGRRRLLRHHAVVRAGAARAVRQARHRASSPTRCRPAPAAPAPGWPCEQWGVAPDMITMAKSMAGGFPISAVIGKAALMDAPGPRRPGRHLRRLAAGLRRGAGRAGRVRGREAARSLQVHRRAPDGRPEGDGRATTRRSRTCAAWAR